MNAIRACARCEYFLVGDRQDQGVCRRHPPTVVMLPARDRLNGGVKFDTASSWPPVKHIHWCGEFSADANHPNFGMREQSETDKPN